MATWMYAGTAQRRRRERRLEQRRRRDMLTPPAFRLLPRGDTYEDGGPDARMNDTADFQIQPVDPRPLGLLLARETACDYLQKLPEDRRCEASNGREVSLDYQVSYCLKPKHRSCGYYRRARGLPPISPQRLAVYTVLILVMAGLIVIAGFQAATSGNDSAATDPPGQGMVGE